MKAGMFNPGKIKRPTVCVTRFPVGHWRVCLWFPKFGYGLNHSFLDGMAEEKKARREGRRLARAAKADFVVEDYQAPAP